MSNPARQAVLDWNGGLRFRGGAADGPTILIDGSGAEAPGPMVVLLLAAASCSGADVVLILEKMRVALRSLRIEVAGVRRETDPKRYLSMHLIYHLSGDGLDEAKARRAIDLSVEKYCSVMHSLAPDLRLTHELRLA